MFSGQFLCFVSVKPTFSKKNGRRQQWQGQQQLTCSTTLTCGAPLSGGADYSGRQVLPVPTDFGSLLGGHFEVTLLGPAALVAGNEAIHQRSIMSWSFNMCITHM